jgi:hypothetical protein
LYLLLQLLQVTDTTARLLLLLLPCTAPLLPVICIAPINTGPLIGRRVSLFTPRPCAAGFRGLGPSSWLAFLLLFLLFPSSCHRTSSDAATNGIYSSSKGI